MVAVGIASNGWRASAQFTMIQHGSDIPPFVRPLFWDCAQESLSWEQHVDFIAGRVLARGGWDAICWVRGMLGDQALRDLLHRSKARWLSRPQIRFWQLVLDLDATEVEQWLHAPGRHVWDGRSR